MKTKKEKFSIVVYVENQNLYETKISQLLLLYDTRIFMVMFDIYIILL